MPTGWPRGGVRKPRTFINKAAVASAWVDALSIPSTRAKKSGTEPLISVERRTFTRTALAGIPVPTVNDDKGSLGLARYPTATSLESS